MTVEAVVKEVLKDEPFYSESGGGVTLSGGEPLDQPDFAASILMACKKLALHTAIETAGHVPWSSFEKIIPFTDLFLFDVKHTDSEKMRLHTRADTNRIIDNLEKLMPEAKQVIVRVPVIPEFNDTSEEIQMIARFAKGLDIRELHLLPYHRYGQGKYRLMSRKYGFNGPVRVEEDRIQTLKETAALEGLTVQVGG
jgi:pyruvate formate lyase activating enzyme